MQIVKMQCKVFICIAALANLVIPPLAQALPFQNNPTAFASYLSSLDWGSSKKSFSNLSNCTQTDGIYFCKTGFITITDPRGTMVCQIGGIEVSGSGMEIIAQNVGIWIDRNNGTWNEAAASYLLKEWGFNKPGTSHHGSTYGCAWK